MKSYDSNDLLKSQTEEKHTLSYDIDVSSEKDTQPSRSYDIDLESPKEKKSDNILSIMIVLTAFIIIMVIICMFIKFSKQQSMLPESTNTESTNEESSRFHPQPEPQAEQNGQHISFTEIDTETEYKLHDGDAIAFSCKSDNSGVYIEYIIDDLTTKTRLCNIAINGGDTFEFIASDYIMPNGVHNLMVTQNAYGVDDKTMSNVLETTYSEIHVEVMSGEKGE